MLAGLLVVMPMPAGLAASNDPVARAEAWFDGIRTMRADFIQVASDGTSATGPTLEQGYRHETGDLEH
ncbi:MAG: hypothetical protein VXB94_01845, partial [Rhodobiaceae bacterium]